jgi:hypothetical protein
MANENGWGDGASNNNIGWGQGAVNNSISWGYLHQTSWAGLTDIYGQSYQPEAAAFFTSIEDAGGTLTDNVKSEFDAFVVREKDAGRWSKIKRLYPYLGGKIDSAVIDAVTLNSATNSNFVNGDVDALCGMTGDGSTKKLDTALAANIWASTNDWQIYLYEIEAETGDKQVFGAISGGNDMIAIRRRNISTGNSYIYGNNISISAQIGGTFASNQSIYGGRFTSTDLTVYENDNTNTNTTLNTFAFPVTYPISLFARNGASSQYSNAKVGCHMMAEGMSKTDMQNFDTSYKTFINNITAYAAAQAYFTAVANAGGTLTTNVKSEFTSFVNREVEAGRWSKYKAVYPMIGGNLASVKINVVNPGTFDLTLANFVEADVDAICGLQSDGSTKHAQIQGGTLSNLAGGYSLQFADYAITLNASPSRGVYNQGLIDSSYFITHRWRSNISPNREYVYAGTSAAGVTATSNIQLSGDSFVSCINGNASTTTAIAIRNGVTAASNSFATVSQMTLSNEEWALFALNNNSVIQGYQDMNAAGFWIATELSESEAISADISYKTFINNIQAYKALMDSYSGAAVAYSLRKVYSTYEGAAINVRRSSDNATQDIGFDGYVLDEAALLSFVGAGDGYVTTWYDQSGNGNNATQSTAANQPLIVSSGSLITDGGKSAINFDGLNDFLQSDNNIGISGSENRAWSAVLNRDDTGGANDYLLGWGENITGKACNFSMEYFLRFAGTIKDYSTTGSINNQELIYVDGNGVNIDAYNLYLNGTLGTPSTSTNGTTTLSTTDTPLVIGATYANNSICFDGTVQEIIIWGTTKPSDRASVESLINTYYSIY